MRRTSRSLADAREELVQIEQEFTRLQKRIEAVGDCVTDSLVRLFGEQRPAFTGLREEKLIERIAKNHLALSSEITAPLTGHLRQEAELWGVCGAYWSMRTSVWTSWALCTPQIGGFEPCFLKHCSAMRLT